ncbi:MAG: thioredoxin family protein [Myxococcales bacterium]|nr:thioredoxin family protein [Myxococcales bacterium]
MPTHLQTREDFAREVLRSELPVIVDVWSPTCAPCKKLVPVLIRVATKHQDRVKVAELSTDAEPQLLAQLGVRATPTILVYEGGHEVGRMSGFRPAGWFDEMIEAEFPEE